jgi:PBSX family phage terminase large subunit
LTVSFSKTEKQKEATKLMASNHKHIMLLGGSRSGKTFIIVRNIIVRACKEPNSRHVSLRKTFNSVKTSIFLDTLPKVLAICFPDLQVTYNKTDYYITFPNGSEYWFAGLDDDKRVEKILGKEYSTIHFNEVTQLDYRSVQIALTRLAQKNNLSKKVYYDMNPGNKSSWSYHLFIKKLNPVDNEPLSNPDDYVWMRINPIDNMQNIDEDYLNMLNSMPELERIRFLNGEFNDESDGQVYHAFRRDIHVTPIERKQHTTWYIGLDFNVNPMTASIMQIIDDKIEVFDEVFLTNSDTPQMISELKRRGYAGLKVIPDSTGANRKTSGASDFQLLREAGFQVMQTHNPFVTDRVNNVNRLFNSNKIKIDPKCKKLINDLEKVVWKDNKLDQKTDKLLTHMSDNFGYACHKLMPMIKIDITPATSGRMM